MEENIEFVHDRWQRQPQNEEEQREMEHEMCNMHNTLGEWSDSDDDWVLNVEEKNNTLGEWSDSDDDWVWDVMENDEINEGESTSSNTTENVQVGRGKKRKNDEINEGASTSSKNNFYVIENVKQTKSKKFRMTATNYSIRFNNAENTESELSLTGELERTHEVFGDILDDITGGMNEEDQVRFVLRSEQLDTPISLPFMSLFKLTPERIFSQIERIVQSQKEFRLNDTVTVDIIHVETPRGSGSRKRTCLNIEKFLKNKGSIVTIRNKDELCLARALVVAIAKIEKDPKYKQLTDSRRPVQEKAAKE